MLGAPSGSKIGQPGIGILMANRRCAREVGIHSGAIDLQRERICAYRGKLIFQRLAGALGGGHDRGLKCIRQGESKHVNLFA